MTFAIGQTAELGDAITKSGNLVAQGGFVCILMVVCTGCLVVGWKYAMYPFLREVSQIVGQVREVVTGTERTASILAKAVDKLDPALWESGPLHQTATTEERNHRG